MTNRLKLARQQVVAAGGQLEALSPLKVLERGYSVTRIIPSGTVLRFADQTRPGDLLETLLQSGRVISRVEESSGRQ
jgi:exodeoxyribonuclease VII large subunit